jgi:hypothetical protein
VCGVDGACRGRCGCESIGAVEQFNASLDLEAGAVDQEGDEIVGLAGRELAEGVQLTEQGLPFAGDDAGEGVETAPSRGG